MLAPPKTLIAFWFLGEGVPPLLSDQHVTQAPLQTYGYAEGRAAQVCKEKDHLPACARGLSACGLSAYGLQPEGQKTLIFPRKKEHYLTSMKTS